ncbi:hypothetical protein [Streptomyces sp. NPDC002746]
MGSNTASPSLRGAGRRGLVEFEELEKKIGRRKLRAHGGRWRTPT